MPCFQLGAFGPSTTISVTTSGPTTSAIRLRTGPIRCFRFVAHAVELARTTSRPSSKCSIWLWFATSSPTISRHFVITLADSATVGDARQRFASGAHGAYPLVDEGRLVGIVTRGDVLRADVDEASPAREVSSRQVVTAGPTDTAQKALRLMVDEHIDHVPVVDDNGHLIGICTRTDLLKVRRREFESERRQEGLATRLAARRAVEV